MVLSQENANKIRQKSLQDQERIQGLTKEIESNRKEIESLTNRLDLSSLSILLCSHFCP